MQVSRPVYIYYISIMCILYTPVYLLYMCIVSTINACIFGVSNASIKWQKVDNFSETSLPIICLQLSSDYFPKAGSISETTNFPQLPEKLAPLGLMGA